MTMGFLRLAGNIIRDVVKPELEALTNDLMAKVAGATNAANRAQAIAQAAVDEVKLLRKQMGALQALDIGFKETGKLILLTRIGDQDRVKIIDIKASMDLADYKRLVERVKEDFGVGEPVWVDKPAGMDDVIVGVAPMRRGVRSR